MNSIYSFIIQPKENRYNNIKKINNKNLILNTSIEDHRFVSRNAIVVALPKAIKTNIKVGDEIIVHHNVFRRFYDIQGEEKNSANYFKENLYFCYLDQIFLFKQNNNWKAINGYCFVQPIKKENSTFVSEDKEEPLKGFITYSDGSYDSGKLIGFSPESEYEFIIDKKRLYRVPIKSITIEYDSKGTEKPYNPIWVQSS